MDMHIANHIPSPSSGSGSDIGQSSTNQNSPFDNFSFEEGVIDLGFESIKTETVDDFFSAFQAEVESICQS